MKNIVLACMAGLVLAVPPSVIAGDYSVGSTYKVGHTVAAFTHRPFPRESSEQVSDMIQARSGWKLAVLDTLSFEDMIHENLLFFELMGCRDSTAAAFGDSTKAWLICRLFDSNGRSKGMVWMSQSTFVASAPTLSQSPPKTATYCPPDTAFARIALWHLKRDLSGKKDDWVEHQLPEIAACSVQRRTALSRTVSFEVVSRNKFGEVRRAIYRWAMEWQNGDEWGTGTWVGPYSPNGSPLPPAPEIVH